MITRVFSRNIIVTILLLIFSQTIHHVVNAYPSIYLNQPQQEGQYVAQSSQQSLKIPLEFQLFGLTQDISKYEFCFSVKSNHFGTIAIETTCLPAQNNQLVLNGLKEDEYTINCFVKEKNADNSWSNLESTTISNVFLVLNFENALPKIELLNVPQVGDITLIADAVKNTADFNLDYSYTKSVMNHGYFTLCLQIIDATTNEMKLKLSCLTANDRKLTLNNLAMGKYIFTFILKDLRKEVSSSSDTSNLLPSTQLIKNVIISSLTNNIPKIQLLTPLQEYAATLITKKQEEGDQNTHQKLLSANIQVIYQLDGFLTAIQQTVLCIDILRHPTSDNHEQSAESIIKHYCLPSNNNQFSLPLEEGSYQSALTLAAAVNNNYIFEESRISFPILIKHPEEFVPSYQWQPLHPWHTIPSGIETRYMMLPLCLCVLSA